MQGQSSSRRSTQCATIYFLLPSKARVPVSLNLKTARQARLAELEAERTALRQELETQLAIRNRCKDEEAALNTAVEDILTERKRVKELSARASPACACPSTRSLPATRLQRLISISLSPFCAAAAWSTRPPAVISAKRLSEMGLALHSACSNLFERWCLVAGQCRRREQRMGSCVQ